MADARRLKSCVYYAHYQFVTLEAAGMNYQSEAELFGVPLIHIANGYNIQTGQPMVTRGWIAIGNVAVGIVFAMGGVAVGGVALGGLAIGPLAVGGMAVGMAALGGAAFGAAFAAGGLAVSLMYAIGGMGVAPHVLAGNRIDPEMLRLIEQIFGPGSLPEL